MDIIYVCMLHVEHLCVDTNNISSVAHL